MSYKHTRRLILGLLMLTGASMPATAQPTSKWVHRGANDYLLYSADAMGDRIPDFSAVGYKGGGVDLPDYNQVVGAGRTVSVSPGAGNDRQRIQDAIDQVSSNSLNANGFRGVVQLEAGEFQIDDTLHIRDSGVIFRGRGDDGANGDTTLKNTKTNNAKNYKLLSIDPGSTHYQQTSQREAITDKYVPVGARAFNVKNARGLRAGDQVIVERPSTEEWVEDINMTQYGWDTSNLYDQQYRRRITRIEGNRLFLDAPMTNALEQAKYGLTDEGPIEVYKYKQLDGIHNVGVENIRGDSVRQNNRDERNFIAFDGIEDGWVRNITARSMSDAAVRLEHDSSRITVEDARSIDPFSVVEGNYRYPFTENGHLSLMRDLYSEEGRHSFVNNVPSRGPNVFVFGKETDGQAPSGPHQRWSTGTLYDNLDLNADRFFQDFQANNVKGEGSGHGWVGNTIVFWNLESEQGYDVDNPPGGQNWNVGGIGGGDYKGYGDHQGQHVSLQTPSGDPSNSDNSLYLAQLADRFRNGEAQFREYVTGDYDDYEYQQTMFDNDDVRVAPEWAAEVQTFATANGKTVKDFDQGGDDALTPFTFDFELDPGESVVWAQLTASLDLSSGDLDDSLYLESTQNEIPLTSLNIMDAEGGDGQILLLELLPGDPEAGLTFLNDGRLNALIGDDEDVNWANLQLRVVPEPASVAVMGLGGLLLVTRRRRPMA